MTLRTSDRFSLPTGEKTGLSATAPRCITTNGDVCAAPSGPSSRPEQPSRTITPSEFTKAKTTSCCFHRQSLISRQPIPYSVANDWVVYFATTIDRRHNGQTNILTTRVAVVVERRYPMSFASMAGSQEGTEYAELRSELPGV